MLASDLGMETRVCSNYVPFAGTLSRPDILVLIRSRFGLLPGVPKYTGVADMPGILEIRALLWVVPGLGGCEAKHYVRTWLVFDIVVLIPDVMVLADDANSAFLGVEPALGC